MRKEIAKALYDFLRTVTWGEESRGFLYTSERLQAPEQCAIQPAFFCTQGGERFHKANGAMLPIRDLEHAIYIYWNTGKDPANPRPGDEGDMILDEIDARLSAFDHPDQRQTLGGMVHNARIDGDIIKIPGDLDGQGMLIVPIWTMVP